MLDFDGVLHPTTCGEEDQFCKLRMLDNTLSSFDCNIVISSSWRHHFSLSTLIENFSSTMRKSIVGTTGPPFVGKWARYQEILDYCAAHGVRDWRALDDSFLEFPNPCKELILCDPNTGLDKPQVLALKQWLGA